MLDKVFPEAVLNKQCYEIMCFGGLKEQRKENRVCFNKSLLLLSRSSRNTSLSLHSPLTVIKLWRLQATAHDLTACCRALRHYCLSLAL